MKELATALAKAQAAMKPALKDSTNPHFKSKYADLTSVWEACRDALTKNGLSVIQSTDFEGDSVWIRTILVHSSGEMVEGRYPLRPQQQTPQGYGSAISYARRYALAAMVGVVADDDDGNAASAGKPEPVREEDAGLTAAKAFVSKGIREIGAAKSIADVEAWSTTWGKHVAKLRDTYPGEAKVLDAAIAAQTKALTPKAAAE